MISPRPRSKFAPSAGSSVVIGNGLRGVGAAYEISQGCITYFDPNTGEAIYDANVSGNCLPPDTGADDALAQWAASNRSDSNTAVLNAQLLSGSAVKSQDATGVCGALGIPCPTNIPSPLSANASLLILAIAGIVLLVAVKK